MKQSKLGVGERINLFDNSQGMVYDFNTLFPECPLPDKYSKDEEVIIGQYVGGNRREIHIAGERFNHKMYNDLIYGIERHIFFGDETDRELEEINGIPV